MWPCGDLERAACGACSVVGVLGECMHAVMRGVGTRGMQGMQRGNEGFISVWSW